MAVTLTTEWTTVATAQLSYFYDYSYTWTIALQARYGNQSGNSAIVYARAIITNNSAYQWYGTNKGYNIANQGYVQYTPAVNGYASFTTTEYSLGSMTGGNSQSISGVWSVMGSYVATASETVVMPQFEVAPSKPTISAKVDNAHQITITWGVRDFGVPSSGSAVLQFKPYSGNTWQTIDTKTATGQWTKVVGWLTALTRYEIRAFASNSSKTTWSDTVGIYTSNAIYVPDANSKTDFVETMYVPLNGLTKRVIKLYRGNADGEAERIFYAN